MKGEEMVKQVCRISVLSAVGFSLTAFCGSGMCKSIDSIGTLVVSSRSFVDGQRLPVDFTCDGKNISPHIRWQGVPVGGKSFALICDDPDAPAGNFVHWVIFNIPVTVLELAENVPAIKKLEDGSQQGVNGFGRIGYGGACPPRGHGVHRYLFTVYALDCNLGLQPGASRAVLEAAILGHVLARGQIIGRYSRP
jgi:Raf kinase inhibitor-like YbhB/YbcL family protein